MIVVADGDIATNEISQQQGPMPMGHNFYTGHTFANKDFFLNSIEYLVNPSDILETRSKDYTLRLLDPIKIKEEKLFGNLSILRSNIIGYFIWIYLSASKKKKIFTPDQYYLPSFSFQLSLPFLKRHNDIRAGYLFSIWNYSGSWHSSSILGYLAKKIKRSLSGRHYCKLFLGALALVFFIFIWVKRGQQTALEYISGYLMEWSLSIDNIFVFILIFSSFKVKEKYYGRVLLIGILMAIFFRVIFITAGVALVHKFEWILLIFGAFLIYTGYKMFTASDDEEFDPHDTKVYKIHKEFLTTDPR